MFENIKLFSKLATCLQLICLFFFFSYHEKSCMLLFVQSKLSLSDDASWKEREAAVLALGAIAEGCINGLYPHLSEVSSIVKSTLSL